MASGYLHASCMQGLEQERSSLGYLLAAGVRTRREGSAAAVPVLPSGMGQAAPRAGASAHPADPGRRAACSWVPSVPASLPTAHPSHIHGALVNTVLR